MLCFSLSKFPYKEHKENGQHNPMYNWLMILVKMTQAFEWDETERELINGKREVVNGGVLHASPISGKIFVLVGAGGAGRALAFGAKDRGARVVIFNRNYERAKALAAAVSGEALPYECLDSFYPEKGMILANASAIGMEPNTNESPVAKEALRAYKLVFDAVYTPRNTRLLQEAAEVGATVVSGVEMFIRQALHQFRLFTGGPAPEDFMRKLVHEQF